MLIFLRNNFTYFTILQNVIYKTFNFSADPPSSKAVDSDTESMVSSVSGYTLGGKKKKRYELK